MSVYQGEVNERQRWNQIVGLQICLRREDRGMTQMDLARAVGLAENDKGTISKYESGSHLPSAHMLFKLAKALSCSMDFFYGPIKRENLVRF